MDFRARSSVRWAVSMLTGTAIVLCLHVQQGIFAKAGQSPERFIGWGGQSGTYEEVQRQLDHLEWQEVQEIHEPPTHSLRALYDGQMAWRKALANVEVVFTYSLQRAKDSASVIAQKRQHRSVPDNYMFEAHIAMKGEKRFTRIRDLTPDNTPQATGEKSASRQPRVQSPEFVYAYDGSAMRSLDPPVSMGYIHRAKLDAVDSRHMWYFDAVSIPTGPNADRQSKSAWCVPTALSQTSVYRVLPTLQLVDGFPCHVVTSGADTIWIDAAHGFCMRRRVWFQRRNFQSAPVLNFIYVNKDIREYADNIWLPNQCFRLDCAGSLEPANTQGALTEINTVTAKTIRVNTVKDDLFELSFPAGTNVQDLVRNKSYLIPRGEHLLDQAVAQANPIVNGQVVPARPGANSGWVGWRLLIANGIVLCLLGGRWIWRLRSKSAEGMPN
jgi:hypothetical protein